MMPQVTVALPLEHFYFLNIDGYKIDTAICMRSFHLRIRFQRLDLLQSAPHMLVLIRDGIGLQLKTLHCVSSSDGLTIDSRLVNKGCDTCRSPSPPLTARIQQVAH